MCVRDGEGGWIRRGWDGEGREKERRDEKKRRRRREEEKGWTRDERRDGRRERKDRQAKWKSERARDRERVGEGSPRESRVGLNAGLPRAWCWFSAGFWELFYGPLACLVAGFPRS